MSTADAAASGAKHLSIAQGIKFGAHLVGLVVLSRLLGPEAFGVVAIATSVVGVAEYIRDFGLSAAAIRERHLPASQRDALFWTNVALGAVLASATFVAAEPIASLFNLPELSGVLRVSSAVFLINGVGAQYRASLNRELRYGTLALSDGIGPIVGLTVALTIAVLGGGYWALAAQFIASALASTTVLVVRGNWRPGLPRRVPGMRHIYRFGANYAASQLVGYLGNNVDTISLGYFMGPGVTGVYSRSFQITVGTLDQLKSPALTIAVPSLSRVRSDPVLTARYALLGQLVVGLVTFPIAALLAAGAIPVVHILLGPAWGDAAGLLPVLAVAASLQQLAAVASWLFVSSGDAKGLRNYTILSTSVKVVAVLSGVRFGAIGVAAAYAIAVGLMVPIAIRWSTRSAKIRTAPILVQGGRHLLIATIAGVLGGLAVGSLTNLNSWAQLAVAAAAVAVVYAASAAVPSVRRDYLQAKEIGLRAVRKQRPLGDGEERQP